MKLHILGSGTCVPNTRRGSSGYALELDQTTILFDCGGGTTWKLGMIGIDYLEVDHIFITHFHPDHTVDLITFLFATKYPHPNKCRHKPLSIWGPKGFIEFFSSLRTAYKDWIAPENLNIKELPEEPLKIDNFVLTTIHAYHTENSVTYRIDANGKSIVYSGDTGYTESLIEISRDVDLLVIECSFPDEMKYKFHLTPSEVGKIIKYSGAKKVILTHLYPDCDEIDIVSQIKQYVNGDVDVKIAEDLMKIDILDC